MPHHSNDGAGSSTAGSGLFLTTQWNWLSKASDRHSMESIEARELLCKTYWRPLYNFIRRKGHGPEDAEDLTQSFFAVLLEKNFWERANPEKGRFRCLLLKALTQYLLDQRDRANTAKRGKGISIISLDRDDEDGRTFDAPARDGSPEEHFNRSWAWALLMQAREKLREEYTAKGKAQLYQSVDLFCDRPDELPPYAVIARQLGMSVGALKTAVSRMRERYCTLVRQEVARTVGSPEEIDAEIEFLFSAIAK